MSTHRFRTEDVRHKDRFAYWREAICEAYVNLGCDTRRPADFAGEIALRPFEGVGLSRVRSTAQHVVRRRRHIAQATDAYFLLSLQRRGTGRIVQRGREAVLRPGECALYSSTDPYDLIFAEPFEQWVFQVPRQALLDRLPVADQVTGIAIGTQGSDARLVAHALDRTADAALAERTGGDADRLLDLIGSGLATIGGTPDRAERRNDTLTMLRVCALIAGHVGDPEFDRSAVARATGLSVRRLNELFARRGTSLSAYIRDRRLDGAGRDLRDPALRSIAARDIARKWGFRSGPHFSRLFAARFGVSPGEFRASPAIP